MKKMLIAVAGALTLGLSAVADVASSTWFNGGVATGWPTATTLAGGAWSNTTDSEYVASRGVDVWATSSVPLTFTATSAKNVGDGTEQINISTSIRFLPKTSVPSVASGKKAGVIVVKDGSNYAYYYLASDGTANAWTKLADKTYTLGETVEVTIASSATTPKKVTYTIDGTAVEATIVTDSAYQSVAISGGGTLASLAATYTAQVAEFTIALPANVEVASVDGATWDETKAKWVADWKATVTITYKPMAGYYFSTEPQTRTATVTATNAEVPASKCETSETSHYHARIDKTDSSKVYYTTLTAAMLAVKSGECVTLLESVEESGIKNSSAFPGTVTLDLGGYTWTLKDGEFVIYNERVFTIKNGTLKAGASYPKSGKNYMIKSYGKAGDVLTFDGVTLDADNRTAMTNILYPQGGSITFKGGTTIVNPADGANAITASNYASKQYVPGTITVAADCGTLNGNITMLANFTWVINNASAIASTARYYGGAAGYDGVTDDKFLPFGLKARTGTLRGSYIPWQTGCGVGYKPYGDGLEEVTCEYHKNFAAALSAVAEGGTVTVIADSTDVGGTLEKSITLDGGVCEMTGDGFAVGSGETLTIAGGYVGFSPVSGTVSLTGGKYTESGKTAWEGSIASGYRFADLATVTQYGTYKYQIIAGSEGKTGEQVFPISTEGTTESYKGELAFTKQELVERHVIDSTETSDADTVTALNTAQANTLLGWENAVLGLDGTKENAQPIIHPESASGTDVVAFSLGGVSVDTTSGAKVTYRVWSGATPGAKTDVSETVDYDEVQTMPLPTSGVKYYTLEIFTQPTR